MRVLEQDIYFCGCFVPAPTVHDSGIIPQFSAAFSFFQSCASSSKDIKYFGCRVVRTVKAMHL